MAARRDVEVGEHLRLRRDDLRIDRQPRVALERAGSDERRAGLPKRRRLPQQPSSDQGGFATALT
jgi:hypothetical protein